MKRLFLKILGLVLVFAMFSGYSRVQDMIATQVSRVQGVVVTQDSTSMTIPYESFGWVEVSREAPLIQYRRIVGQLVQWLSFGYFPNPSQKKYLQGLLNYQLSEVARKNSDVEAVINTKYWPDLTAKKFPQGRIYAKGEMIRYKGFSE